MIIADQKATRGEKAPASDNGFQVTTFGLACFFLPVVAFLPHIPGGTKRAYMALGIADRGYGA